MSVWTIDEARVLLAQLENEFAEIGWHVGLAGSVLHCGVSGKDLDAIVYPHTRLTTRLTDESQSFEPVRVCLRTRGWLQTRTVKQMHRYWRSVGSRDTKLVEVWQTPDGRRVDFLILS